MKKKIKVAEHTPGPWFYIKEENDHEWRIESDDGGYIASINMNEDEWEEANARLISAAPQLFTACKAVLGAYSGSGELIKAVDLVVSALLQAKVR